MARQEKALLRHPRRLARAKLELVRSSGVGEPEASAPPVDASSARSDLTAQVEPFHIIARELPPLFERHWKEIALHHDKIPLEPDWQRYFDLACTGTLRVMTARCDGVLVGYIFNLVGPHLHYRSSLHAEIEMFWLDPAYRDGAFALRWFKANERYLRGLGVKRISVAVKNHFKDGRVGLLFKRLDYTPIETIWSQLWA